MMRTPLSVLYCPSRRLPRALPYLESSYNCNVPHGSVVAKTDYAGNGGTVIPTNAEWDFVPKADSAQEMVKILDAAQLADGEPAPHVWPDKSKCNGTVCQTKALRPAEIPDGSSKTYFVAEKFLRYKLFKSGVDPTDDAAYLGYDWDIIRWAVTPSDVPLQDQDGGAEKLVFGSSHPGVFQAVFCDGSTRVMNLTIDGIAHQQLCKRDDETPIQSP